MSDFKTLDKPYNFVGFCWNRLAVIVSACSVCAKTVDRSAGRKCPCDMNALSALWVPVLQRDH